MGGGSKRAGVPTLGLDAQGRFDVAAARRGAAVYGARARREPDRRLERGDRYFQAFRDRRERFERLTATSGRRARVFARARLAL